MYPDKALADTSRLSPSACGLYFRLIFKTWMKFQNESCGFPDDDEFIALELGVSIEEWKKARAEIMNKHDPLLLSEGGRLISKGLAKEKMKQKGKSVVNSINATRGWKKRRLKLEEINQLINQSIKPESTGLSTDRFTSYSQVSHASRIDANPMHRIDFASKTPVDNQKQQTKNINDNKHNDATASFSHEFRNAEKCNTSPSTSPNSIVSNLLNPTSVYVPTEETATTISDKFWPPPEEIEWAKKMGFKNIEQETKSFIHINTEKGEYSTNWIAAWRGWMKKSVTHGGKHQARTDNKENFSNLISNLGSRFDLTKTGHTQKK